MENEIKCPECDSPHGYPDGNLFICPECAHEWSQLENDPIDSGDDNIIRDANGAVLADGDGIGAMNLKSEFVKKV